ncbi:hypothetical protein [Micromonospora sp. WMMD1155]|uniref:hypothetical protein n=1 Tax=Micromonospora sp. WMMD1155 TaxID=3016094 RepID=UPI00249A2FE7|nr:hypothetical protein [Micromonospora sp. WMMD1155]WFE53365.1 hypothetical protein O7617_24940 [Micromonospora sp. WMMD1155]
MPDELVRRLVEAKRREEEIDWSDPHAAGIASEEVAAAERALAAARDEQYAEVIDIGFLTRRLSARCYAPSTRPESLPDGCPR